MAEHKHGEMDIQDHEATFDGFVKFITVSVVLLVLFALFMAVFVA